MAIVSVSAICHRVGFRLLRPICCVSREIREGSLEKTSKYGTNRDEFQMFSGFLRIKANEIGAFLS